MRFNLFARTRGYLLLTLPIMLLGTTCKSAHDTFNESARALHMPIFYSPASAIGIAHDDKVVMLDRKARALHQFGIEPFTLQGSRAVPLDHDRLWVLGGADAAYNVVVGGADYVIVKANGETTKNPAELQGEIQTAAFSASGHFLVLMDEYLTMAVIELDADGTLKNTYLGGPNLGKDDPIIAGTLLGADKLLVSQGEKTLTVVDLPATLEAQEWQVTSFEINDAKAMTSLAVVPDFDHLAVVKDADRLFVVNVDTQTIEGTPINLSGRSLLSQDFAVVPHFITIDQESQSVVPLQIHYIDAAGALMTKSLQVKSTAITRSLLNASRDKLTLVFAGNQYQSDSDYQSMTEVMRYRLTDGLLLDKSEVDEARKYVLLDDYMLLQSPSSIGLIERRTYGRQPEVLRVTKHNLPFLKKR